LTANGAAIHRKFPNGKGSLEIYRKATRYICVKGLGTGELTNIDPIIDETFTRLKAKKVVKGEQDEVTDRSAVAYKVACKSRLAGRTFDGMIADLQADPDAAAHLNEMTSELRARQYQKLWDKAGDWKRGEKGQILAGHPDNVRLALRKLEIYPKYNAFADEIEIGGVEVTDAQAIILRFAIQDEFHFLPTQTIFDQALIYEAHTHKYHPVCDYLDLKESEKDGVPRIDTWLTDYAGAEDTPLNRALGRKFLIAAVRRVRQPGVKFDTMPIFESPQGKDKSKGLAVLAVRPEWFSDCMTLDLGPKEAIEQSRGVWIAELAELSGIDSPRGIRRVKTFMSRQYDRARSAYARRSQRVARQFVCAGSVNDAQYFADEENRRFWPVAIVKFQTEKLRRDVDKLWAEAAYWEAKDESIELPTDLREAAREEQVKREISRPLEERLGKYLNKHESGWLLPEDVWGYLDIKIENQPRFATEMQCESWDLSGNGSLPRHGRPRRK
jgi:hypothetical protein